MIIGTESGLKILLINKMNYDKKNFTINDLYVGQRIDNFLIKFLKGIPKSKIYHLLRNGKIKLNNNKIYFYYKLKINDIIYIPDLYYKHNFLNFNESFIKQTKIFKNIIYEDNNLLIINKPNGLAAHSGSKNFYGLIEILRYSLKNNKFIELVHRIDQNTSGLILLTKKKSLLTNLHDQLRNNDVNKQYLALVHGCWNIQNKLIKLPLFKTYKKSVVDFNLGKMSYSYITIKKTFKNYTLIKIRLLTGRHHQIRSKVAYLGHPIVFDDKYGSVKLDKLFTYKTNFFLKRYLFLHSYSTCFFYNKKIKFVAPLNIHFINILNILNKINK